MPRVKKPTETGFVLITALWLLLLCGSLVALLMLHSLALSRDQKGMATAVQAQFDIDAAMETIVADLAFRGGASRWAQLPAGGTVEVDGRPVTIAVSSESTRFDLNDGDLAVIDRSLIGQTSNAARALFIANVRAARSRGPISSLADIRPITAPLQDQIECADNRFTMYSGLQIPEGSTMAAERGSGSNASRPFRPGEALRLEIGEGSARAQAVIRVFGTRERLYGTLSWSSGVTC